MFLRESLYRLGELSESGNLDDRTADLFQDAMRAALELAKAEADSIRKVADYARKEAELAKKQAIDAEIRRLNKIEDLKAKNISEDLLRGF